MTVSSQVNRKDYAGNGSTTAFATEFRFLEDEHLKVILTVDSTGVETEQALTTNYTVTGKGDDSGGTVTMLIAPATGETLTIKRDVPFTQNTDYVENDDFPAESHERALDKLTMVVQQQQEELDRSLKLSEGQQSSGLTIPAPDTGKFLQWDALGNFINVDLLNQGLLVVTAFGQSLISAVDAAAGRVVMNSMKKISSAVTNNVMIFDSSDEAKDSGVPFVRTGNAAGAADLLTVTFAIPVTALTDTLEIRVRALLANLTSTPTINIDGLGAKAIVKNGNQALSIGDIAGPDHELQLVYNLGNDNLELLNPSSAAITKSFESTLQTITSAGLLTLAHGLGEEPQIVMLLLECVTNEHGYTTGQRLGVSISAADASSTRFNGYVINATNVLFRYSSSANCFYVTNATTGVPVLITNANWNLIVRAYA